MAKKYEELNDDAKGIVDHWKMCVKCAVEADKGEKGVFIGLELMCDFAYLNGGSGSVFRDGPKARALHKVLEGMRELREVHEKEDKTPDLRETEYLFWVAWQVNGLVNKCDGGDAVVSVFPWERVQRD